MKTRPRFKVPCALLLVFLISLAVPGNAGCTDPPSASSFEDPADDEFLDDELDTLYDEAETGAVLVADPLEPFNRMMFQFNDDLYFVLIKPVATGYGMVVPSSLRTGINNFFYNWFAPIRIVNCLLQGKIRGAGIETQRFTINTTAGMLGFFDISKKYPELTPYEEDLGQTLGAYGIGNIFYFVIPVLGPSTVRDAAGWVGDRFLSPFTYVADSLGEGVAVLTFRTLNSASFRIGDYETLKSAAIDPYAAFRDGYVQYRNSAIRQ